MSEMLQPPPEPALKRLEREVRLLGERSSDAVGAHGLNSWRVDVLQVWCPKEEEQTKEEEEKKEERRRV